MFLPVVYQVDDETRRALGEAGQGGLDRREARRRGDVVRRIAVAVGILKRIGVEVEDVLAREAPVQQQAVHGIRQVVGGRPKGIVGFPPGHDDGLARRAKLGGRQNVDERRAQLVAPSEKRISSSPGCAPAT